jgi:hypothetical protein
MNEKRTCKWLRQVEHIRGRLWHRQSLSHYIQILISPLVSFCNGVVCSSMIYRFWLLLGIFWPLCCLFFYDLQILITPLVSFGHCVVCSSVIYIFWLSPWYLLAIVLSVPLWYTDSDYTLGIFWPLCCLFFYDIQILITLLVYVGHCVNGQKIPRGNQNLYIIEEQTTQWPKDTKGVIRVCIS